MENQQNNKSRIPRKLKPQASFDQKKIDPAALIASSNPVLNTKIISKQQGKLQNPSIFGQVKSRGTATAANISNSDPQTFKTSKVGQGIKMNSKFLKINQEKKQTIISTATKTPNVIRRKWAPSGSSRRGPNRTGTGSAVKSAIKSTMTVQEKTKRFTSILRREDLMMTDANDECQQKKLVPAIKRKNKDEPVSRNVRRREALTTNKLNNLRNQNAHLKADLSAAQITKAAAIAERTSLEVEKERLKKEHNIKFGEVCQLEHVLACEQSKVANLLVQIAKQHSDYLLMAQEKDNLKQNRAELEEKNNEADKKL
ncbi:hypothetical protein C1645_755997, partial [Glomus cerebriforme]